MNWEPTFTTWAQGPSEAEATRMDNTERAIREALLRDDRLARMNIKVFAQGSYKANTNVKHDSDVDICVLNTDYVFGNYPDGRGSGDFGLSDTNFSYAEFKNMVGDALISRFGAQVVTRGNKAFDIHANSYRVDADVIPAFEHRRYTGRFISGGRHEYYSGIEFHPDDGGKIINWPEQTYSNGCNKNDNTSRRYKRVIRILKRLRNQMQDEHILAANNIGSFLIESLVWNAPNTNFGSLGYQSNVRAVLAHTFNETLTDDKCKEWGEVNELKYLFRGKQPWTREQAHNFLSAAWDYIGLI